MAGKANISELAKELNEAAIRTNDYMNRSELNSDARYNRWAGQSGDGRKWKQNVGYTPVPFDGCSDAKVPLVDTYVNEDVDLLMTSLRNMQLSAAPLESNDAEQANMTTNLLRYASNNAIDEFYAEAELCANTMLENGISVMGVFWEREQTLTYEEIDLEQISLIGQEQPRFADAVQIIMDPAREAEAIELGTQLLPDAGQKVLRKIVTDLRNKGVAKYPTPMTTMDRPTLVSLRVGEDFFVPLDTTELQKARMCFYREFMTEEQLRDAVNSRDWDKKWVDNVVEKSKGMTLTITRDDLTPRSGVRSNRMYMDTKEVYEIIHCYERKSDDYGVPGIWYTVFSPHCQTDASGKEICGTYELLDYANGGMYPFVLFRREYLSRRMDDSRGYGEVAYTWQRQIKQEWDGRVDRSYLATIPPIFHPPGRPPTKWGPGVMIPRVRSDDYQYADQPDMDFGSREIEDSIRECADRYFGRPVSQENRAYSMMRQQNMVSRWLNCWKMVFEQVLALYQQYAPEEFMVRVVGSDKAQALAMSRDEIQGQYDIILNYQVANTDQELLRGKLELLKVIVGEFDINGIVDRTELMSVVFSYLDPILGERLLRPAESADQMQIDDEKTSFAKIFAGMEDDIKPGQAHGLRLQVLDEIMSNNGAAAKRYMEDPQFKDNIDKRRQQHQHQLDQAQNAQIGRLGA